MMHYLRGTMTLDRIGAAEDDDPEIEVQFEATYEHVPATGPTASCGGQPPEDELIIESTDPPGYEDDVFRIVSDDLESYIRD